MADLNQPFITMKGSVVGRTGSEVPGYLQDPTQQNFPQNQQNNVNLKNEVNVNNNKVGSNNGSKPNNRKRQAQKTGTIGSVQDKKPKIKNELLVLPHKVLFKQQISKDISNINSVLTCISNIKDLISSFYTIQLKNEISNGNYILSKNFYIFLEQIFLPKNPPQYILTDNFVRNCFQAYSNSMPQNFLYFFLNQLHSELSKVNPPSVNNNLVPDTFYGKIKGTFKCNSCSRTSNFEEVLNFPLFNLIDVSNYKNGSNKLNLHDALSSYYLEKETQGLCKCCNKQLIGKIKKSIFKYPNNFIIYLNHNKFFGDIDIPLDIDFSEYSDNRGSPKIYYLSNVISLVKDPSFIHYISHCRCSPDSDNFLYFDESNNRVEEMLCACNAMGIFQRIGDNFSGKMLSIQLLKYFGAKICPEILIYSTK